MLKFAPSAFFLITAAAVPAFAGVNVSSPGNGAQVSSPFNLSADASSCSNQSVVSMAYSVDSGSDAAPVHGQSLNQNIDLGSGSHTLHVKAWGEHGAVCVSDVDISVNASEGSSGSAVPSDATSVSSLQSFGGWQAIHDTGTNGSSSGSMKMVGSPSHDGSSREFETSFSNGGGERFSVNFSDDAQSQNFFYDAWVYLPGDAGSVGNLEFDINQTMENGQTVLMGVQCDGYSGTWDYTANEGSASHGVPHWVQVGGTHCNPRALSRNTWHHIQASYSRDSSGHITYHSVWLDGAEGRMNATVNGAFDLSWGPTVMTQFQIDGMGSGGSTKVYVDDLKISRW